MASLDIRRSATTVINLMDNTNYAVELGKERVSVHTGDRQTLVYTVNIFGAGNTDEEAKAAAQDNLDALVEALDRAKTWHDDKFEKYPLFLRRVNDGESANGVTAVIHDYAITFKPTLAKSPNQLKSPHMTIDLAITVGGWEKGGSGTEILISESVAADGGFVAYEGGDGFAARNSRIHARLEIPLAVGAQKIWMGVQPYRQMGIIAMGSYDPVWKLGDDGFAYTDTSMVTGTDSLGTDVVQVTFATNTGLTKRVSMEPPGAPLTYRGQQLMLLRCRVTNADTDVFIRLGGGFVSSQIAYNETVRMTGETDWVYIPMGVVSFPPSGDRAQPSFTAGTLPSAWGIAGYDMYLDAERNSGTGNLEMDALIMVPYGHFISLDNINVPLAGGTVYVVTNADGQIQAIEDDGATYYGRPTISDVNNWSFPYDGGDNYGVFVVVVQRSVTDPAKTVGLSVRAHPGAVFYG